MGTNTLDTRATGEYVQSVVIFSRHGDRTPKVFGTTKLTPLGQTQMFNSGQFYRSRYLNSNSSYFISGINPDEYVSSQIYAAAPDQPLLVSSAQIFLQGLYPPHITTEELADGTQASLPGGLQFPLLHTISAVSPETIWLKGDDGCPKHIQGLDQLVTSSQFNEIQSSTLQFYQSFADILDGVFKFRDLSYINAFLIYDYINVGTIHNSTIAKRVSAEDLKRLRFLSDSHEWSLNGNITTKAPNPISISGSTLATRILGELVPSTKKISIFFGSYDTFLSFFALTSLPSASSTFYGLPGYGSTLVFELVSSTPTPKSSNDISVRFLFRNGTDVASPLLEFPLFGRSRSEALIGLPQFRSYMNEIAIKSVPQWCEICSSAEPFCPIPNPSSGPTSVSASSHGLKPAVAGVVGAICSLVMVAIVVVLLMLLGVRIVRKKNAKNAASIKASGEESGIEVKV